ncbi:MAG: hypothetical protein JL50_13540 [Peptococcaceae bacterium BICA1-7]|nr:MAG: hypothetical protein JL50_13540 [Peptococcaceae bacterium BICA1-7]HBV99520.1 hypothetical protein [Desulfotomaculum sp.]
MAVSRSGAGHRLRQGWNRVCLVAGRPARQTLRLMRFLITGFVVFFSPLIVWLILAVNRELIHYIVNARWAGFIAPDALRTMREDVNSRWFVSGFNEAALGGLLTLYGVIVTVWYYHSVRQQEVVEKRLFVIDELLEELKKNKKMLDALAADRRFLCETSGELFPDGTDELMVFHTRAWQRLGADVAMLPRILHLKLSVLYSCLMDCGATGDYQRRRATIDRLPDIITELQRYRRRLN